MKLLFALATALSITVTSAKWTCDDCTADADWMCAPLCAAKSVREITCEECFEGLQKGVDQLLLESTIQGIVEALSGEAFCGNAEEPERCAGAIEVLIPLALPALAANPDREAGALICNNAIPDTC